MIKLINHSIPSSRVVLLHTFLFNVVFFTFQERSDLQDQLQRLSMDKFKKLEDSEELQGFQVQELAKVKHMVSHTCM